jgi:hypothetical protein
MPSLPAVLKILTSFAALAQPHISKFIDDKKEISKLRSENEFLKKQTDTLRTQRLILAVIAVLLCAAFIAATVIIITKGLICAA